MNTDYPVQHFLFEIMKLQSVIIQIITYDSLFSNKNYTDSICQVGVVYKSVFNTLTEIYDEAFLNILLCLNPFVLNATSLYLLKTENHKFS